MESTSASLLDKLREPVQNGAWERFVALYRPLLVYWGRRNGLQASDAEDLAQEVLALLAKKMPEFQYNPAQTFRGWLRTVALNRLRDRMRRHEPDRPEGSGWSDLPDSRGIDDFWETEHQQHLIRRALEVMQADFGPTTWKACWRFVVDGQPAAAVAQELQISENAVYLAKFRVLRRLRQELEGLWDG